MRYAPLLATIACGGLSDEEAARFVAAHDGVLARLQPRLHEVETWLGAAHTKDGAYVYDGEIAGPPFDGGAIYVVGNGFSSGAGTDSSWDLALDERALASQGIVFDGPVDAEIRVLLGGDATIERASRGTLVLDGELRGKVSFDFGLVLVTGAEGNTVTWTGEVGGTPVADLGL